jgi:hypothetical protein
VAQPATTSEVAGFCFGESGVRPIEKSVMLGRSVEGLSRYVDDNKHQPLGTILVGLEEHDLWRGTSFESAHTFAEFLEEIREFEGPFGRVVDEVVVLAAEIVRKRGGSPEAPPLALMSMANLLSCILLVEGIVRQINSAEAS